MGGIDIDYCEGGMRWLMLIVPSHLRSSCCAVIMSTVTLSHV